MEALVILVAVLLIAGTYGLYRLAIALKETA
jgi:NADH:ubiquinone oxidoreductase subunit 4 (subunit M)